MTPLWFNPGVEHRRTSRKSAWARKAPETQIAIISAANKLGGDYWELVKAEFQEKYLREARALIEKGVTVAKEGGQGTKTRIAACSGVTTTGAAVRGTAKNYSTPANATGVVRRI